MKIRPIISLLLLTFLAAAGCEDPEPPPVPDDIFAPLGEIAPHASAEQRLTFDAGLEVMQRQWTIEAGLGPHFNLSSCGGCHERPMPGGSAPRYRNFLLIQDRLPDGTQMPTGVAGIQPQFHTETSRFETPENANVSALRNSIPMFGVGLLAEITEESILANQDPDDEDGDGISGRPNYDRGFVGRFGRKAQTVSIEGFIRGPLFNHLGITSNPLSPEMQAALPVPSVAMDVGMSGEGLVEGDVGAVQMHQAAAPAEPIVDEDGVPDPEITERGPLRPRVSFAMLLAAPTARGADRRRRRPGTKLFDEVGCGDCHVRGLVSPRGTLPLYSDLLLPRHGARARGRPRVMGLAMGNEFRTQPLWGIAGVGPYLHDGRADTLDEAIRFHGGEAERSRDAYVALSDEERGQIVAFLESLGGRDQRSEGLIPPDAVLPDEGTYGGPRPGTDVARFEAGRALFDRDSLLAEGLGPTFNGDSCRACHFLGGVGGAGPIDLNVTRQSIALTDGTTMPPMRGTMAHRQDVGSMRPAVDPSCDVFELRQTPPLFGLGLVDEISEAEILAHEDPDDLDGDGISGRAHVLTDGRVGRLGWKANVPNLAEFTRDGMTNELGITVADQAGLTFGSGTDGDETPDPEISVEELEAITFFMTQLAAPPRTRADMALEDSGEALFESVGCAGCHMTLDLPDGTPVPLYSDLLLHDVFPPDLLGIVDGDAGHRELRTPPLWGLARERIRTCTTVGADTIAEAILAPLRARPSGVVAAFYEALGRRRTAPRCSRSSSRSDQPPGRPTSPRSSSAIYRIRRITSLPLSTRKSELLGTW